MIGKYCYQISKLYVDQIPVELHILKVEKLDVCISPLSANPVTYIICNLIVKFP